MKIRHNKKRNTAFVYEALIREGTSAILQKDETRKKTVVKLIKKHFPLNSVLRKDLECHRSLYRNQGINKENCARIVHETYRQKKLIDADFLFTAQTDLIRDINKELNPSVFNNFVPNYKSLATISQLFSQSTTPRNHVLLENVVIENMSLCYSAPSAEPVDNLVIEAFVKKLNEKYDNELLDEQRQLLNYYITSFTDNALELKMFINEEVTRLKEKLTESRNIDFIAADKDMLNKTNQILEKLGHFKNEGINDDVLMTILKTQSLIKEIFNDVDHN